MSERNSWVSGTSSMPNRSCAISTQRASRWCSFARALHTAVCEACTPNACTYFNSKACSDGLARIAGQHLKFTTQGSRFVIAHVVGTKVSFAPNSFRCWPPPRDPMTACGPNRTLNNSRFGAAFGREADVAGVSAENSPRVVPLRSRSQSKGIQHSTHLRQ